MRVLSSLILLPLLLSTTTASAALTAPTTHLKSPSIGLPQRSPSLIQRATKTLIGVPSSGFECPAVPDSKKLLLPSPPYDVEQGDCALVGRGEEVEAYLTALEQIAQGCRDRVDAAWQAVQDARDELDSDIDSLPPPPPEGDESGSELLLAPMICSSPRPSEPSEPIGPLPDEGHYYTEWLRRISENVQKYCTMVNELVKPIVEACEEIQEEAQCMVDDPAQGGVSDAMKTSFHSRVSGAMNAASLKHDYVLWFYENTLETYGWGNFREYYHEENIECSTPSQPGLTGISPGIILRNMGLSPAKAKTRGVKARPGFTKGLKKGFTRGLKKGFTKEKSSVSPLKKRFLKEQRGKTLRRVLPKAPR